LVGCLFDWLVGSLVGQHLYVSQTEQNRRVGRWLYNVNLYNQLYLSITTLTEHPTLFAEDVGVFIKLDYDLVRRKAKDKEYMVSKNFVVTLDAKGMTIHLENLFNGNKLLGK
jgi:hypothetical protein